jgi:hypothetical protein
MHLKTLGILEHNGDGPWKVGFHDEFFDEFGAWSEAVQDAILSSLGKLREFEPSLGRPSVDILKGSAYSNMKELRVDSDGGGVADCLCFRSKTTSDLVDGRE